MCKCVIIMKIERDKHEFAPVTIKLETQEELEDMLVLFSRNSSVSLNEYLRLNESNTEICSRIRMFDQEVCNLLEKM